MRIGLVCPYAWDIPGGVQIHIKELAEWLISNGHEVSVLAPVIDGDAPREKYVVSGGKPVPIPFNGSVARILFGPVASNRVRNWITENEFDLLHLHEPAIPSLTLLALWAGKGAIVGTFHAQMEKIKTISAIGGILDPAIEKLTAKIAVSEPARVTLKERYETEAVVIPNGVAVKNYFTSQEGIKNTFDSGLKVGFIGRFDEPRKGLGILLSAWRKVLMQFPNAQLLIAGPSEKKYLDNLISRESNEFINSLKFLGKLTQEQKVNFFQEIDIYVAPNTGGESFGIILVEAMAAGAPIVASNLEAFSLLLPNGILFENENVSDLSNKLVEILNSPILREELSQSGREFAQRFDWDRVGNEILDVYRLAITGQNKVVVG